MGKHIVVTGGSGKAGQEIIAYLLQHGHEILNFDLSPLPSSLSDRVHTIRLDLADTEPFREPLGRVPDAVIHLGGYARNMMVPDNETFRGNIMCTYSVMEAACRLNIKKIITASSVAVYGVRFADGDTDFPSFPVEEDVDTNPMDAYAISKLCGEYVARGFARSAEGRSWVPGL
ncbi:hypothetical protein CNMCM5623_004816 [Aspergillus felis]|uniref:NAD-dependent epimerase/dehydratase domain-containing protein n=1 Tax=Aspergillus felis TaxID=1287682 RepID=A0A8H6ULP0_9EURO|nr:hypothetical protein CNMCM5623_004816 [Aspergillus felis]